MNKYLIASIVSVGLLQGACAKSSQNASNSGLTEEDIIAKNEQRIDYLENQISALNAQIEQMNNRVYEVRTKSGQKTSMTVVPATAPSTPTANATFESAQLGSSGARVVPPASAAKPQGRVISPGAKPTPLPKNQTAAAAAKPQTPQQANAAAGAAGSVGRPEASAGASGQLGTSPNDDLSLPPSDLPAVVRQEAQPVQPAPAPALPNEGATAHGSYRGSAQPAAVQPVPIPVLPDSGISLPPETSGSPQPASNAVTTPAAPPAAQTPAVPTQNIPLPKGEANAYNAALKAVRSGKTTQGIQMFREFLQQYPSGKYAANADYWIGECLYQQGKYSDALSQFNAVNSSFPTHHKNADALLKAGMSLGKMGDSAGAQEKYKAILAQFPASDAAKKVRAMGIR